MTGVALADLIGVTRTAVTQYEKNVQTPRPDVMQRITEVMNLPFSFFTRESEPAHAGSMHYRSLAAATKTARRRAQRRHLWLRHIVAWLTAMVELPALDFPDFNPPSDPGLIDDDRIERAAEATRRHWGMGDGPIPNVTWLLENRGAVVSLSDFGSEDLDAFSESGRERFEPYVSLSADKAVAARANFTAAHELGHLLLHRNIPDNVANRATEHKTMEGQANKFADALLLPATTFSAQVRHLSLERFQAMKSTWRVSIGAMIMRSKSLSLIDEDHYRRLWISYSKRGWKRKEPLDDELSNGGPRVLRRAFELILDERVVSRDHIRAALPYAPSDIESLCGLEPGFLSEDYSNKLVRLPGRATPAPTSSARGDVLPFGRLRR